MKVLEGKVAFITGGSSGLGLGIARALAIAGMKVVVTYRARVHLDEAMRSLKRYSERIHAINVDVTDRLGMERAAAETVHVFGRVHVLVNNADIQLPSTLSSTSYEDWDRLIGTNITGVFNTVHAFLPKIRGHDEGGHIITTASIAGLFVGGTGYGAYYASKFAVVGFTEALRAELSDSNIGVSVFCPGVVKSNLEAHLKDHPAASDPLETGQLVLRGIQNNALYIVTHPEFEPMMQLRHEAMMASIPRDVRPPEARLALVHSLLQNSVYRTNWTQTG